MTRLLERGSRSAPAGDSPAPWTTTGLTAALVHHFTTRAWSPLLDVDATDGGRGADVLCVRAARTPGCAGIERLAIDVVVSRSTFLAAVHDPTRLERRHSLAHRHAFAVPAGLVDPWAVPLGSGLIEVQRPAGQRAHVGVVGWTVDAPGAGDPGPLPDATVLDLLGRLALLDARSRHLLDPSRKRTDLDEG